MAEDSDTKDVYDAHYGWNSGFAHAQWSAMRDVTLTTCLNPLHRLHRVPAGGERGLGDVVPDAAEIVESMIVGLLRAYPGASISLGKPADASSAEAPPTSEGAESPPAASTPQGG
jgi:hypothetical protein